MASIIGNPTNEFISGTADGDFILALAGNDTILGQAGDDVIGGNEDDDIINGNPGNDLVRGGMGDDRIFGDAGNDALFGDFGNDTIFGNIGTDALEGGEGEDLLDGNEGADILNGNDGRDTVTGGTEDDIVRGGMDDDVLQGEAGDDDLFGDKGSDRIFGGKGADALFGGEGKDTLGGNEGRDTLLGELGDDLARGGMDDDRIFGDMGNDTLFGDLGNDSILGEGNDDLINGNDGNDTLNGNEGNDTVRGGMDDDLVRGGMDNDELFGDLGNDSLFGDLGNDIAFGGKGTDFLLGGEGNDALNGNEEDDTLDGNEGLDTVRGGKGNDLVRGGKDSDGLFGDLGNDTLFGELADDTVFGGEGTDSILGNEGDDLVNGNEGNDTAFGGGGNDTLRGGMGNDSLLGEAGNDTLFGDLGADTLTGNAGDTLSDIFVLGRVTGAATQTTGGKAIADADIITDFQPCIDFISLTGVSSSGDVLDYGDLLISQGTGANAKDVIIQDKGTGEFLALLQGRNFLEIDGTAFIPGGPPRINIRTGDSLAAEPATGKAQDLGFFTVETPCPVAKDLVVNYTVTGNAVNGTDFNSLSGAVTILAGTKSAIINLIPLADTVTDPNETVTIFVAAGVGYESAPFPDNKGTVTIADSPPPAVPRPTVIINAIDPNASEKGSNMGMFEVARTGGDLTQDLVVELSVTGTAILGKDYSFTAGTGGTPNGQNQITIGAGKSTVSFGVSPGTDGEIEPTETVVVSVAEDIDYFVGAASSGLVAIEENTPLNLAAGPGPVLRFSSGGAFQSNHPNITAAVGAAADNDIIVAREGTYAEASTVTINRPLVIRGPNAGISPSSGFAVAPAIVRVPATQPVFTVANGTSGVTIEGLRIEMGGENGVRYQNNGGNIVVRQNEFTGTGPNNGGVIFLSLLNGPGSSATVADNLIRDVVTTGGSVTSGIQLFSIDTVRATNNVVANLTGPGIVADAITNPNSTISDNRVSNLPREGIQLAGGSATIENNDITRVNTSGEADRGGIRLRNSGNVPGVLLGTVNVLSNTITNSFNGVAIRTPVPPGDTANVNASGASINFNNFIGNSNAALFYGGNTGFGALGTLNAKSNWWDDPNGPVVGGTGRNAIAGPGASAVDFSNFSTVPF